MRANPPLGMRVNVAGTVNVLRGRLTPARPDPRARLRELDRGLQRRRSLARARDRRDGADAPSTASRSSRTRAWRASTPPTRARLGRAAPVRRLRPRPRPGNDVGPDRGDARGRARDEPYAIGFTGTAQYDYAPDVARAFLLAAQAPGDGAAVYNAPGVAASVEEVVEAIRAVVPGAELTWSGDALPFPAELEAVGFDRDVGPFPRTPLAEGVAATIAHFRDAG